MPIRLSTTMSDIGCGCRRVQITDGRQAQQPPLYELVEDRRLPSQRSADGRYSEPEPFDR